MKTHLYRIFFICLLMMISLAGCSKPQQPPPQAQQPQQVTVTTAHPVQSEVVEWNHFTGRIQAIDTVDVRARVHGYLQSVHFKEGQLVKEGDLLFVIDPRPYQADLEQAQGRLATAEAKFQLTQVDLQRARQLLEQQAYAQETYDQRLAASRQAQGDLEASKAAVQAAQLNLEFTEIKAPISGKIGKVNVTEGNLIDGGTSQSTLLTTIVSLDPIYCYFTVDERAHLQYVRLIREGKLPKGVKFPVWIGLADENGYPHEGYVDFVDNRIDPATATINVRAVLPNANTILIPGLFARVRVAGSNILNALLIPEKAVTSDQAQKIVYVINKENKVERRSVELGWREGDLRVVKAGLNPDDNIVVNGIQRIRPGITVSPQLTQLAQETEFIPQSLRDIFSKTPRRTSASDIEVADNAGLVRKP